MDEDGITDLVVGLPHDDRGGLGLGTVLAISAATGAVLHATHGFAPHDPYDFSVACLGDVDKDGRADFAMGASQLDCEQRLPGYVVVRSGKTGLPLWRAGATGERESERTRLQFPT